MPHGNFRKLVLIDGVGVPLTPEADKVVLYNPDGTLLSFGPSKEGVELQSPNGTLYNITVTDDGTLNISAV